MNQAPSIPEYVRALRQRVRWILLAAFIFAGLFGGISALIIGSTVRVNYYIEDSGDRTVAALVGAPSAVVPNFRVNQIVGEIELDLLANFNRSFIEETLIVRPSKSGLQVVVESTDGDERISVENALNILNRAVERHRIEFQMNLERIETATTQRVAELFHELDSLDRADGEISGVQTFMIYSELLGHQRMLAGLDQLRLINTGGVTDPVQLGIPVYQGNIRAITFGFLGLILGTVIAGCLIIVRRFFEPRILSSEDIVRSVFAPRFIELITCPVEGCHSSDLIGLAAALSSVVESSEKSWSIQLVSVDADMRPDGIATTLVEALQSLGYSAGSLSPDIDRLEVSEVLTQVGAHVNNDPGATIISTANPPDNLAMPIAIGRVTDRTVVIAHSGVTRISSLREIVRELEVSGIDCDGVALISG